MNKVTIRDTRLPHLSQALDPEFMTSAFEALFREQYPNGGIKVEECRIDRVYHKPGKNCTLVYHLVGHGPDSQVYDQCFYVRMPSNSRGRQEQLAEWPGCGFWKPVSFWPEMNGVVHAFPYDPHMPYLGWLLQQEFVKEQADANLGGFGLDGTWKCSDLNFHLIKYMPTRRCVLKYEVGFTNEHGEQRSFTFYCKTYHNARSRYIYQVLDALYKSPACREALVNIPQPIAHLDAANSIWQMAWEGRSLHEVITKRGWDVFVRSGLVQKISATLAAIHHTDLAGLELRSGPASSLIMRDAVEDAANVAKFMPSQSALMQDVMQSLEKTLPMLQDTQTTIIHGTFKMAQILCREDQVAVVDFDSVALGDPMFDVAEFLASILYLHVRDRVPHDQVANVGQLFLEGYEQHAKWSCDRHRVAWYVVGFLLGKIHSSLKRWESTGVENLSTAFDLVEEWAQKIEES